MRILNTIFCLTVILSLCTSKIFAQITITFSDLQASTAAGVVLTNNEDTLTTSWNIGSIGATSFDFTGLTSHVKTAINYIDPAPTQFISYYPSANVGEKMTVINSGTPVDMYMYMLVNSGGFNFLGISYALEFAPGYTQQFRNTKSSPDNSIQVPLTNGTTWTVNYNDTTKGILNGNTMNTEYDSYSKTYTVDAYGSAFWPDGSKYSVLRLKTDSRKTTKFSPTGSSTYSRQISYSYIAKEGISIQVTAKDTNAASSGIIQLGGKINWTTKGSTGINDLNYSPNEFLLYQNYPNPFNPSTIITYQLAKQEKVNLRIYDMLGKEVAVLVNEVKLAGTYSVTFNASELPSGVYIYRLNSVHLNKSNKMILIK